jgi:hypothetical protein
MADVNKTHSLPSELINLIEEPFGLFSAKRRGWLIENEKLGISGKSLSDFYQLLCRNPKRPNQPAGGELQAKPAKLFGCPSIHLFPVDEKSLPRQMTDENVFGDTEIGEKTQFLVNEADTGV